MRTPRTDVQPGRGGESSFINSLRMTCAVSMGSMGVSSVKCAHCVSPDIYRTRVLLGFFLSETSATHKGSESYK